MRNSRFLTATLALLWAAWLSGCATGTPSLAGAPTTDKETALGRTLDQLGYSGKEPARNFRNTRFWGWTYIDDYHLILRYNRRQHYLLEFRSRCFEARSATTIGFKSATGFVSSGDKVIVDSDIGRPRECWIDRVYLLTQKPKPAEGKAVKEEGEPSE